ncbi:MAG: hypothetical protein JST22_07475 [Bacteroidetes bacterium]|nr:hypothetical protein [Bacteroidota bacterium]
MSTDTFLRPMDLGDQFATTFQLIRRSAGVFLLAVVLMAACSILYQNASYHMMGRMAEIAASGGMSDNADPELRQQMGMQMLSTTAANLGFFLIYIMVLVFSHVMAAIAGWEAVNAREISLGAVFTRAIGRPFWASLLQTIIMVMLAVVVVAIVYITFIAVAGVGASRSPLPLLLIVLILLYPLVATAFRIQKVSIESRGPWKGLIASIALVKGNWGRTFLTLLIAAIGGGVLIFLTGMLTGGGMAFQFGSRGGGNDPQAIIDAYNKMKESYSIGSLVATNIVSAFAYTFCFFLLTPMYTDLRARRGELLETPADDDLEMLG